MNAPLRPPCQHCPFRERYLGDRDYLRPGRRLEIVKSVMNGGSFPCHETVEHDDDGEYVPGTEGESDCVGLDIMMLRHGLTGQMLRIRERIGLLDPARLLAKSKRVKLWTWADVQDDAAMEGECCSICDEGCEAPAGWLLGGNVVEGVTTTDNLCPVCGEHVCYSCMDSPAHECAEYGLNDIPLRRSPRADPLPPPPPRVARRA